MSSKRFLTAVAWSTGAVSVAAFVAAWVLAAGNGDPFDISAQWGPDRFMVAYALAGTILASRRRSNPVGWLLLAIGLVTALRGLAGEYARYSQAGPHHPGHPGAVWAAWYVGWSLALLFPDGIFTFLLLLLFPDGRPLTRRWWAVFWAAAVMSVLFLVITWLDPAALSVGGLRDVPNPTGLHGLPRPLYGVVGAGTWVSAGKVTCDLAIVAGIGLAMPVAIGIAVLKYRLYAIDKIISRTVSYVLVTGLVVGVYLGCVALLSKVQPIRGSVGVAVSVLAAAALFNPLRRRVQAAVDRRFDRARYDAERVVTQFSERLREEVDLDVVGADLLGVVQQVLAPAHMSLWLRDPAGGREG